MYMIKKNLNIACCTCLSIYYMLPSYLLLSYKFSTTIMEFFWTWVYELVFDVIFFVKDRNRNVVQMYKPQLENFNLLKLRFHLL
jgi:hypothetical protein